MSPWRLARALRALEALPFSLSASSRCEGYGKRAPGEEDEERASKGLPSLTMHGVRSESKTSSKEKANRGQASPLQPALPLHPFLQSFIVRTYVCMYLLSFYKEAPGLAQLSWRVLAQTPRAPTWFLPSPFPAAGGSHPLHLARRL